jgi:acyl carrier protein
MNAPTQDDVVDWLVETLAEYLDVSPSDIDTRASFMTLGLTSALAVAIMKDMEQWLGREVPPSLLFDYPSIDALARALGTG